ncbi:hypothetical protein [Streptomyces sp. NPDC058326]
MSDDGLPCGVQLVGPHLREDLVLAAGAVLEDASARHRPAL